MRQSLTAFLVLAFLVTTANGQPVLYASQSFPNDPSGGNLFIVDQATGLLTGFAWDPTSVGMLPAIAFDSKGYLWGSENKDNPDLFCAGGRGSGRCGHLIKINPANGSLIQRCEAFEIGQFLGTRFTDFSFQPGTDRLFGLDTNGTVYIIQDPCLGAETPGPELMVGPTGLNRGGLAFHPDGRLYLASVSGQLARIDPANGSVIGPVLQMLKGIEGAGFRPTDGVLWGTGDDARQIYTIDLNTGAQSLVIDNNGVYTTSLTFTPMSHLQFSEWGNGGGLKADLSVSNPSSERSVSGRVDFFAQNGDPLPIGIVEGSGNALVASSEADPEAEQTSVEFSVGPLDSVTIPTDGLGDLKIGGAVVVSDGPLGGVVRFAVSLFDLGIAGVGASEPLQAFIIPVRRQAGGTNTGVAMRNPGGSPVKVTLKLLKDGQEIASTTIDNLVANGQTQKFIDEFFPNADTDDFVGTMVVEVEGGKVAALALEQGVNPGEFTTLPVTPLI